MKTNSHYEHDYLSSYFFVLQYLRVFVVPCYLNLTPCCFCSAALASLQWHLLKVNNVIEDICQSEEATNLWFKDLCARTYSLRVAARWLARNFHFLIMLLQGSELIRYLKRSEQLRAIMKLILKTFQFQALSFPTRANDLCCVQCNERVEYWSIKSCGLNHNGTIELNLTRQIQAYAN